MIASSKTLVRGRQGARVLSPRLWFSLFTAFAVVLGLGCSLGGDGGGGTVEPLGSSRGAFVSDTAPLVCPAYAPPVVPGGLLPPTPAGGDVAGSLPGAFEVNDAGAAVYAMPLEVPPGRAGLAPTLALSYDSDRENGLLGMGFRLDGLSAIRRCGHNYSDEGDLRAVAFDAGDRFCLDGRKLFAVRGAYGLDGTEYRTDPDVFTRVLAQGDAGGGPLAFLAFARDGRIYEYGTDAEARVAVASGAVATWSLRRVRDRLGNVMTYDYEAVPTADGAHQHRVKAIRYTGHTSGLAPERAVEFDYDARWDVLTQYAAGEAFRVGELLTGLRTYGPEHVPVRDYAFAYSESPSTQRARLRSVQACAGEGAARACLPPTVFGWGDAPLGFSPDKVLADVAEGEPGQFPGAARLVVARSGDFNGDGTDDLVYVVDRPASVPSAATQAIYVRYNYAKASLGAPRLVRELPAGQPGGFVFDVTPLDHDEDGRTDLLLRLEMRGQNVPGPPYQWLTSTGEGFADAPAETGVPAGIPAGLGEYDRTNESTAYFADLDGDGHADVVSCVTRFATDGADHTFPYWTYQLHVPAAKGFDVVRPLALGEAGDGPPPAPSLEGKTCLETDLVALDFDGDGGSELLVAGRGTPGSFRAISVRPGGISERDVALPALAGEARLSLLDLNGDGLRDVVVMRPDEATSPGAPLGALDLYLNTGADLRPVDSYEHLEVDFRDGTAVLDYDGDGREDLLVRGWSTWMLLREVGPGGASHTQFGGVDLPFTVFFEPPDQRTFRVLDVDGDGDDDLVAVDVALDEVYVNGRDELRQDRLLWVRDGLRSPLDDASGGLRAMSLRVEYDFLLDRSRWPGHDPAEPARYRSDPGACAPSSGARGVLCLAGEKRVVTHTWSEGNGAAKLEHDFYYQGARHQRLGAGWLGFASRAIVDRARGAVTELSYDNASYEPAPLPGRSPDDYPYADRFLLARRPVRRLAYDDPWLGHAAPASNVSDVTLTTTTWAKSPAEGGSTSYVFADEGHTYRYQIADFRATGPHPHPAFAPFDPGAHSPLSHGASNVEEVDAFGNVRRVRIDDGLVEDVFEHTFVNDATGWLVGLAASWRHTSRPLGPDAPPAQTREASVAYQPGTPLPSTIVLRDPDDASATLTEARTYDAYGNLTYRDRFDPQGRRRQTCLAYEPEGVFPGVVTGAAGHATRVAYDRALGVPLAAVDPNGLATRWSYDPFGRPTRALSPEGADATVARTRVTVDDPTTAGVDPALFTRVDVRTSGAERRELWSAEGRLVRVEGRAFAGLFGATRIYDVAGRLVAHTAPTLVDREAPGQTSYAYDGVDRPTKTIEADGLTTSFRYEGLVTSTVRQYATGGTGAPPAPPLERTTRLEQDARGRVVRSVDAHQRAMTYAYGAFDHVRRVTDPAGNVTGFTIDAWGRTRGIDDPDAGARTYTYNAFGQLETALDAKNQLTRFVYDGLGRPTEERSADGTRAWVYDEAPFGVGKLSRSSAPGGVERAFTYDPKGRPETSTLRASLGDDLLTFRYGYDDAAFGRLRTLTYPAPAGTAPYRVRYAYDAFGHLERLSDDVSQAELWRRLAPAADVADRQTLERFGNGVQTANTFEPTNGLLKQIRSWKPGAAGAEAVLQDLRYGYTPHRALWHVDDAAQGAGARETFGYDALDRLTLDAVQGPTGPRRDATYAYDDLGNLTRKSDLGPGPLVYGQTTPQGVRLPHALTSFGGEAYDYDANGNQTRRPDASLTYNAFHLPKTVVAANQPSTEFSYDAAGARVRKRAFGALETVTFDDLYERRRQGNESKHVFYVRAGGRLVASVERSQLGTLVLGTTTRYVHANHQGSTDVVTGPTGAAVQRRSYDPFGRARSPDWSTGAPPQGAALLRRGFTEHEHDDEFGLINMRGRVYDPRVGRFLQADPFVQAPRNGQSYNRYSYVLNSPPNFTDPSGYQAEGGRSYTLPDGSPCTDLGLERACANAMQGAGAPSASVGMPAPGNASGAATRLKMGPGGFSGQADFWSFSYGDGGASGVSGLSPCVRCGRDQGEPVSRRWGGGESGVWAGPSAPGPQRSAESHSSAPGYVGDATFDGGGYLFAASRARPMPSNRYGDPRTAAFEAEKYYNPWSIEHNLEVGGLIYRRQDGSFGFTGPNSQPKLEHHVIPIPMTDPEVLSQIPPGATPVGDYHTHGDKPSPLSIDKSKDEQFSPKDKNISRLAAGVPVSASSKLPGSIPGWQPNPNWRSYLGTPNGYFLEFTPTRDRVESWGPYPALKP